MVDRILNRRMDDRLQIEACALVLEYNLRDSYAIHGAVAAHRIRAETLSDRREAGGSRRYYFAREHVGVHDGHAGIAQPTGNVRLACGNPARQRNLPDHIAAFPLVLSSAAVTVFRRTMATVIGPTPPGTGVMAPAISSTSGCTSPTSTLPFSANCARLRLPSAKMRSTSAAVVSELMPTSI